MLTPRQCFLAFVASLAVLLLASACGGGDDSESAEPTPTATPANEGSGPAAQALARYVQSTFAKEFKEDCSTAQAAVDAGKICAILRGERGNERAYVLGQTFSEPTQWVILQQSGGQWNVVSTQAITPDNAGVPGIPWPLRTGVDLVVAGTAPECMNVREGPSINQRAVDCLSDGTRVRLSAGPTMADNFQWWQLEGRSGWVVADYLRYPDALQ